MTGLCGWTRHLREGQQRYEEVVRRPDLQGVDSYTPIAAYLGSEGWCVGLELRPGVRHSALESHCYLVRVLPRVQGLAGPGQPVLASSYNGFDAVHLLFQQDDEQRVRAAGRKFEYLVKWNRAGRTFPSGRSAPKRWQPFGRPARASGWYVPDRRRSVTFASSSMTRRTIDRYRRLGIHEQFHSENKTDLDLEGLPSGKFDCNDLVLHLGMFAHNLFAADAPIRPDRRPRPGIPFREAPPAQDRVAGGRVPGHPVHSHRPAADSRFRPNLSGCGGLSRCAGRVADRSP